MRTPSYHDEDAEFQTVIIDRHLLNNPHALVGHNEG